MLTTEFKSNVTVTEEGIVIGDEQDVSKKIPTIDKIDIVDDKKKESEEKKDISTDDRTTIINALPEDIQTYNIEGIDLNTLTTVEIKDGESVS